MPKGMVELVLEGSVPSKKNSRINRGDGVSFPSTKFVNWQDKAIIDVRRQSRERFFGLVQIEIVLYFGTLVRADTDNKVTSILDMLVAALMLKDDYWESVARTTYEAAFRPRRPGAFIRITELPADFLGEEYLAASKKRNLRKRLP